MVGIDQWSQWRFVDVDFWQIVGVLVVIICELWLYVVVIYDFNGGYGYFDYVYIYIVIIVVVVVVGVGFGIVDYFGDLWMVLKFYWMVLGLSVFILGV